MSFTPEEVQEVLDVFFSVVNHRQYLGARYVPIFGRKDESTTEWDNSAPYEPLTIVTYQGNSYTSRQEVPAGALLTDTDYWVSTGNFNAQVDAYRQEVVTLANKVDALDNSLPGSAFDSVNTVEAALISIEAGADTRLDAIESALPISDFDSVNTVKAAIDAVSSEAGDIGALLPATDFDAVNTVKAAINAEKTARENADTNLNTAIGNEVTNRSNADNAIILDVNTINSFLPTGYAQQSPIQPINDYIIESGTENGWYWRKWYSGVAECFGKFSHESISLSDNVNGVYFSTTSFQENFPVGLFIESPVCHISPDTGYWGISGIEYIGGLSKDKTFGYYFYRLEDSRTVSLWVMISAKGYWKELE